MNFLAHLHLAHLADSSLPGNLMADFVPRQPAGRLSGGDHRRHLYASAD